MEQLFLDVLNRAITAGWLVLVVVVLRLVLKKAPKALHYGLWLLVGLRLLWPGQELLPRSAISLVPSNETIPGDILSSAAPAISSGIPAINSAVNPALQEVMAAAAPEKTADLAQIAATVWLAGAAALLLYLIVSFAVLRLRLRTAVRLEAGVWQSEWVGSPFVLGLIRPRIYLPFGLAGDTRAYVLAHERSHIRRGDHWIKPLAFLLLAVFWFNPLLWLAYVLLCRDMEFACDERVLRDLEEPGKREYSQALLNCAAPRRAILACPVAFGETCVKGRIRKALRYKKPAFWASVGGLVVLTVVALCFFTNPSAKTPYEWASRLTPSHLGQLSLQLDGGSSTIYSVDLQTALAQQLSALEEDDFVPLDEGIEVPSDWPGYGGAFRVKLGKHTLFPGGNSGYPLLLQFRNAVYGVDDLALLETILSYTNILLLTEPEAAAIPLHIALEGLCWGQWTEGDTLYASVAGEDFTWTPQLTEGGDTLELWQEDSIGVQSQFATICCDRLRYQGQNFYMLYTSGTNYVLVNADGGYTLGLPLDDLVLPGLYIEAEALYLAPWVSRLPDVCSTAELFEVGTESYTIWYRGGRTAENIVTTAGDDFYPDVFVPEEGSETVSFPIRGGQSFTDEDWARWFPDEATRPDISGCSQRWLMEMGDKERGYTYLLKLDGELYRLGGSVWDGEVISLCRLRPVLGGLSGEDVLAIDRLLDEISRHESLATIDYTGTILARMRQLDSYQALLDYDDLMLAYGCTMLEYGYNSAAYLRQLAISTACNDILADMGEDVSAYEGLCGQEWYQTLKRCVFDCSAEELEQHPGYRRLRALGLQELVPQSITAIAREDMDGDGVEEEFVPAGTELCLMRPNESDVLWRWALPEEGDAVLWRKAWEATLLEYRAEPDDSRYYRLFTLKNGQEQVLEEARLAPDSDSAAQQAFVEAFNAHLTQEFPPQLLLGRMGDVFYSNTYQVEPFLLGADFAP